VPKQFPLRANIMVDYKEDPVAYAQLMRVILLILENEIENQPNDKNR